MSRNVLAEVFAQLDRYLDIHDVNGAEEFLEAKAAEFAQNGDWQSELGVLNELVGMYRKSVKKEKGLEKIAAVNAILDDHALTESEAAGTVYLNCATACRTFEEYDLSEGYFKKTKAVYEKTVEKGDYRYAALYNNIALLQIDKKDFKKAMNNLKRALRVLDQLSGTEGEKATTRTTLAQLYMMISGSRRDKSAQAEIDIVMGIFENWAGPKDNYYALVSYNCGKSLQAMGEEEKGKKLMSVAEDFYSANRNA